MMTDSYAQLERLLLCCFLILSLIPHPPSPRKKKGKEKAESNEKGPWSFCSAQAQGKLDSLVLSTAADMQDTTPGRGRRAGAYSEGCQAAPTLAPAAGRKERTSLF